jgi:hypothetical protein
MHFSCITGVLTPFVKTGVTEAKSSHNCKATETVLQILQRNRILLFISNILKTKLGKCFLKYNTTSYDVRQMCFIITETVLTLHSLALHYTKDHLVVKSGNLMIT